MTPDRPLGSAGVFSYRREEVVRMDNVWLFAAAWMALALAGNFLGIHSTG
jgi:hypothetical protein